MAVAFRLSGPGADELAAELRRELIKNNGEKSVGPVQVQREVGTLAIFGLIFGGISTADVIWGWWRTRERTGLTVRIESDTGVTVELENASHDDVRAVMAMVDPSSDNEGE